jgi:hypothetical protein
VNVINFQDSLIFSQWTDTSISRDNKKEWIRIREKRNAIKISTTEKDSIFHWTKNLMKPVTPTGWCSDYVGHLLVRINYGNRSTRTEQSCKYTSICHWTDVNADTKSIYKFLKTKFKEME